MGHSELELLIYAAGNAIKMEGGGKKFHCVIVHSHWRVHCSNPIEEFLESDRRGQHCFLKWDTLSTLIYAAGNAIKMEGEARNSIA